MPRTKRSSRDDPLLEAENGMVLGRTGNHRPNNGRTTSQSMVTSGSSSVGCLGHFMILSLPLVACGLVLAVVGVLISNLDGVGGIQTTSVSGALENFQPYGEIVVLTSFGALFTFMVTAARNVQIAVSMRRAPSGDVNANGKTQEGSAYTCCLRFLNGTAAIINVAAYVGFILLVAFRVSQEDPRYAQLLHYIGAFLFLGGTAIYALVHSYLLYYQNPQKYPRWLKYTFVLLSLSITGCIVVYGLNFQAEEALEFEWAAVILTAIHTGLFSVLFHIDNVDDEIRDFFGGCFCCCSSLRRAK